jgi:hypothetical protein
VQSIEPVNKGPSYVPSGAPSLCRVTQDDVSSASNPLRELFAGVLGLGRWLRSGLADLCCCFFHHHPTIDGLAGLAVGQRREIYLRQLRQVPRQE